MACEICCEQFTGVVRKPVVCVGCGKGACSRCCKAYILSREEDPQCLHCGVPWDPLFLRENFSASWMGKEYQCHRGTVLINRERPRVGEAYTQMIREKRERLGDRLDGLVRGFFRSCGSTAGRPWKSPAECVTWFRGEMSYLFDGEDVNVLVGDHLEVFQVFSRLLFTDLVENPESVLCPQWRADHLDFLRSKLVAGRGGDGRRRPEDIFKIPCPLGDCTGFMDQGGGCPSCTRRICLTCETEWSEGHECDAELVETVRLLRSTSRPCPTCSVPIHKVDGCDQMWCTQCHTAFSYATGELEKKRIHNPEYYRWLRETNGGVVPREPGDAPGGEVIGGPGDAMGGADPNTYLMLMALLQSSKMKPPSRAGVLAKGLIELGQDVLAWPEPRGKRRGRWYPLGREGSERRFRAEADRCLRKVVEKKMDEGEWRRALLREDMHHFRQIFFADVLESFFLVARDLVITLLSRGDQGAFIRGVESAIRTLNRRVRTLRDHARGHAWQIRGRGDNTRYTLHLAPLAGQAPGHPK